MTEFVEICKGTVSHLSSIHYCRHCGTENDVELAFIAHSVWETPALLDTLPDVDRLRINTIEQVEEISSRLDVSNPHAPSIVCERCGIKSVLQVRREVHTMTVPAFLWCGCGQEIDLRYPGDKARVRFTAQYPHIPFMRCRRCKRRVILPLYGKDAWRTFLFKLIRLLRALQY